MNFLKNLNGREIAMVITSVGGIILAGILVYYIQLNTDKTLLLASNHLDHSTKATLELSAAVNKLAEGQKDQSVILQGVKESQQELTILLKTIFNRR